MKSIRSRFITIVAVSSIFISISLILYCQTIFSLKAKVTLIERFDDLRNNLLELRRYEKNYFMAGDFSSLDTLMLYFSNTSDAFHALAGEIQKVLGKSRSADYHLALKNYEATLRSNITRVESGSSPPDDEQLRIYGKQLNDLTDRLIVEKRKRIDRTLNKMLVIPLIFILIFLVLFFSMLRIIRTDISDPLAMLCKATEHIARGKFEPVRTAVGKYDEISRCLNAFNRMAMEIETRQEQLLQSRKMASIGTFTSGIAHELNNPINNISLVVDGLIEDGDHMDGRERQGLYNDLMTQADRAADIVKNLLEFSRTEDPILEEVSLETAVDKTVRLVKNELHLQKITYSKTLTGKIYPVLADRQRIQQALLNLILNAVHAMPDGGELTVAISPGDSGKEMRMDIADTGTGIPADQIDLIFDPFFTTKKEGEGTGLGLSVTYGIISKLGGRITVRSTPGRGTCFSIFLPAGKTSHAEN